MQTDGNSGPDEVRASFAVGCRGVKVSLPQFLEQVGDYFLLPCLIAVLHGTVLHGQGGCLSRLKQSCITPDQQSDLFVHSPKGLKSVLLPISLAVLKVGFATAF